MGWTFFQKDWLKNSEYKDWVKRDKDSNKAFFLAMRQC